jgi:hypothetical protein
VLDQLVRAASHRRCPASPIYSRSLREPKSLELRVTFVYSQGRAHKSTYLYLRTTITLSLPILSLLTLFVVVAILNQCSADTVRDHFYSFAVAVDSFLHV